MEESGESNLSTATEPAEAARFSFDVESYGSTATVLHPDPSVDSHWDELEQAFTEDVTEESTRPFVAILGQVREAGCKTIMVEQRYIDSDFRSDYSTFWSQRFNDIGSRAARMHFFVPSIAASEVHDLRAYSSEYLGYAVLRPTPLGGIGRCILRPPASLAHAQLTTVRDSPTLFGTRLVIEGVPFYQQDGEFLRCAHVAAWICQFVAFTKGAIPRRLTGELVQTHRPSPYRMLPSSGLTLEQLQGVLSDMGMPALFYDINDLPDLPAQLLRGLRERKRERILRIVCKYLNSGFPVIVVTERRHAFTLVGWERTGSITRLVACDDQVGPYEPIESPLRDAPGISRGRWTALMIPLPQKTYLNGEAAETRARDVILAQRDLEPADGQASDLARLAPKIRRLRGPISVRTQLVEAADYKERVLRQERAAAVVRAIRIAELPKWVWVVEFQHRPSRDKLQRPSVEAEMVLDPTSANDQPYFELVSTRGLTIDVGRIRRGDADDIGLVQVDADGSRWWSMISQLGHSSTPGPTKQCADPSKAHDAA